jgi:uncharacterized membrane protein
VIIPHHGREYKIHESTPPNKTALSHKKTNTEQRNITTMADEAGASAPAEANKTYLDEVTGEQVSKSELKKRQKARQREEEKAKKAAAAPPKPIAVKKGNAEAEEEKLNPNVRLFTLNILDQLDVERNLAN